MVPRQAVAAVRWPDLGKGAAGKRVGGGPEFPSVDFSKVHKYSDRPLLYGIETNAPVQMVETRMISEAGFNDSTLHNAGTDS